MIISSRSRVSNLLFSNSCINWPNATLATPGLLATTRNASLCVRRAGIPIASPSSRARSSDTIGTREVIVALLFVSRLCDALSLARLGRKWRELKLVRPARPVLGVQIVERLGDLDRIDYVIAAVLVFLPHRRQHFLGDQKRPAAGDVLRGIKHLHRDVLEQFFVGRKIAAFEVTGGVDQNVGIAGLAAGRGERRRDRVLRD